MILDMDLVLELEDDIKAGVKVIELADKYGLSEDAMRDCLIINELPVID